MSKVEQLQVEQLAEWRRVGKAHVLLDVREGDEVVLASLDGALHVPMNDVPSRIAEIPHDATVAVLCHAGVRSHAVARYLVEHGYQTVYNVAGGIDRYAAIVDPSIPRYG